MVNKTFFLINGAEIFLKNRIPVLLKKKKNLSFFFLLVDAMPIKKKADID